ncbi:MAG: hypothetical protein ACSHX0_07785 [Akkermansiaceae bacterium]
MKNSYKLLIVAASAAFAVGTAYAGSKCDGGKCSDKTKTDKKDESSLVDTADISASTLK